MSNYQTMRIKKVYYDAIRDGTKKYEFRSCTPYWLKHLKRDAKYLILHYQKSNKLICKIKSIKIIQRPSNIDQKIVTTEKCFAIEVEPENEILGSILEIKNSHLTRL